MAVKIFADSGDSGDDATQVSKVFHCAEVGATNTDLRRTMLLVEGVGTTPQSSQADGEAKVFGCNREAVQAKRVQLSSNSSSVMSSSMVFVPVRTSQRLNRLSVWKRI